VILVSSGAVGLGRQRLRYRQLVNSRLKLNGYTSLLIPFPYNNIWKQKKKGDDGWTILAYVFIAQ